MLRAGCRWLTSMSLIVAFMCPPTGSFSASAITKKTATNWLCMFPLGHTSSFLQTAQTQQEAWSTAVREQPHNLAKAASSDRKTAGRPQQVLTMVCCKPQTGPK